MAYNLPSFTPAGILGLGLAATGALVATVLLRDRMNRAPKRLPLRRARSFSEPSSDPLQDPMHGARPGVVMSSAHSGDDPDPVTEENSDTSDSGEKKDKSKSRDDKATPPDKAEPIVEHNHDKN
ncbi:hypothetical protein [Pseudooceanicola sp. HF7]|uniref:hypothetical protein n=1 Tax=Pseudooceanicola sp. HF7 TaxID=2721560 RepID=UPI00142FBCBA|nr:hypothetical protein [Pseudooceanicola sp. HF7]NIZ10737.1 hypothetical protein [Pseudooceanicola sp. HF7]